MAISDTTNRIIYQGNESTTTPYVIPFRFDEPSWIRLLTSDPSGNLSELELGVHYTLSGSDITTASPIPALDKLVILRRTPKTQPFVPCAYILPEDHAKSLDQIVMAIQDATQRSGNSGAFPLVFPFDEPDSTPNALPSAALRANKILSFDDQGRLLPLTLGILNDAQALEAAKIDAQDSAATAAAQIPLAAAEVVNAANQVTLAAAQVALAKDEVALAQTARTGSEDAQAAAEAALEAVNIANAAGHVGFLTRADMETNLNYPEFTLAEVVADDVDPIANNRAYIKIGNPNAGLWQVSTHDTAAESANAARLDRIAAEAALAGTNKYLAQRVIEISSNYTLQLTDANALIRINTPNDVTVSLPASEGFDDSFSCVFSRIGTGAVTFQGSAGAILEADQSKIWGRYTAVACHCVGADRFQIYGDLY